jgi:hypothetical protein
MATTVQCPPASQQTVGCFRRGPQDCGYSAVRGDCQEYRQAVRPIRAARRHTVQASQWWVAAAKAEAERYGKPVIILRRPRKRALAALGAPPRGVEGGRWEKPADMPWRPEFNDLGPLARGRLVEAWMNHEMAPQVWREEWGRPRVRN